MWNPRQWLALPLARLLGGMGGRRASARGDFHVGEDGQEVWVDTPHPPHNLVNVLYNEVYETMIDHRMAGTGRHMNAAGLVNNVIERERLLYVRDHATGRYFSAGWSPVCRAHDQYRCRAGIGYQQIETEWLGLQVTWRIDVPPDPDPVEVWDITVRDRRGRPRKVGLFAFAIMKCDGVELDCGELCRIAAFDPELGGIFVRMDAEPHRELDFPYHNGFMAGDRPADGWDANPGFFTGPDGRTLANPVAVERGSCSGSICAMWKPCAALQWNLELEPGKTEALRVMAGACSDVKMAARLARQYLHAPNRPYDALSWRDRRAEALGPLRIQTPERPMDLMLNIWVKAQIHYGLSWGAWGALGTRDMLHQALGGLTHSAALARRRILEALAHQESSGFASRGWRPFNPRRSADSAQWLIGAVTEYVKETGDLAFLEQVVPYRDGGSATIYAHLFQALRRLNEDRGRHGLCLIFQGDWNDSMTAVGRRGRGEGVWLSMAFCRAAGLLAELARRLNETTDARVLEHWRSDTALAINTEAWDGQWYLYAFDDDGQPVGSEANPEGRIHLNAQSWAQLGGVADDRRWELAWAAVKRHLDTGWGLMLHWPAYTRPQPRLGRITYIRPGAAENASVYTHGNAFMMHALLERGLPDEALEVWRAIHPANPRRPGRCMPNIFYNAYYGPDSEVMPGLADHPWVTGSAAWMYHAVIEKMLGVRRDYDGLILRPRLPGSWREARVTRLYRGTLYEITLLNPAGVAGAPVREVRLNGAPYPADRPLPLEGGRYEVQVELGFPSAGPGLPAPAQESRRSLVRI